MMKLSIIVLIAVLGMFSNVQAELSKCTILKAHLLTYGDMTQALIDMRDEKTNLELGLYTVKNELDKAFNTISNVKVSDEQCSVIATNLKLTSSMISIITDIQ